MLKVVFILGCLLIFALAQPSDMEHKRLARSHSRSHHRSHSKVHNTRPPMVTFPSTMSIPQWVKDLLAALQQTTTAAPATTTK
ncbi:hypothetical protein FQN60_011934 [Etheostoma spectabile]|uniref:Uncharacterized protein n=1 Tax=Etheostoma spectabile TaxID=54343 RepID=A0A5J5DNJ4_9PERO|nr:hypothetical protein FQN60_011934 [Etheostoma spectabile]